MLLRVESLSVVYGHVLAVRDFSLEVEAGEIVTILGPNGAGKSSTLNALVGLVPTHAGAVQFDGHDVTKAKPEQIVRLGMTLSPEGRRIFNGLTVAENLAMGAVAVADKKWVAKREKELIDRFPVLGKRSSQLAGTLSGGELQQLAVCRALMSRPRLLLLDEPSLGLAPLYVMSIFEMIETLPDEGVTVLVVEQNVHHALAVADRAYVLAHGSLVQSGTVASLKESSTLESSYLGLMEDEE